MLSVNAVDAWEAVLTRDRRRVAIPWHRVVRGSGDLAGYRWCLDWTQRLLALERT